MYSCITILIISCIACFRIRTELYLEEQEEMERQKEKVHVNKQTNKQITLEVVSICNLNVIKCHDEPRKS